MLSPAITGKLPEMMAIVLARASTSLPKAHCDNAQHMVGADRSGRWRIGYAVSLTSERDQCDVL